MRIGIATDHAGFELKEQMLKQLRDDGHDVIDFGAYQMSHGDDYLDYVVPLAQSVASGSIDRGVALCGSGIGASTCANKIRGVRAGLIHDEFSARQGVEHDHMNVICIEVRIIGSEAAWFLVQTFLTAMPSEDERHLRRLGKLANVDRPRIIQGVLI